MACLVSLAAAAEEPSAKNIADGLVPPGATTRSTGATRSIGASGCAKTRRIEVLPNNPDEVLATTESLPSVSLKVQFEYDSASLTPAGAATVEKLADALRDPRLQGCRFMLAGHTDARGSDAYNQALSERRARAVQDELTLKYRIEPDRLDARGFGKRKPADPARPEDASNRRVEVINLVR
jgi:outer membrane protein OmpA-like peptidoglycan-associated protein